MQLAFFLGGSSSGRIAACLCGLHCVVALVIQQADDEDFYVPKLGKWTQHRKRRAKQED